MRGGAQKERWEESCALPEDNDDSQPQAENLREMQSSLREPWRSKRKGRNSIQGKERDCLRAVWQGTLRVDSAPSAILFFKGHRADFICSPHQQVRRSKGGQAENSTKDPGSNPFSLPRLAESLGSGNFERGMTPQGPLLLSRRFSLVI